MCLHVSCAELSGFFPFLIYFCTLGMKTITWETESLIIASQTVRHIQPCAIKRVDSTPIDGYIWEIMKDIRNISEIFQNI